MGRQDCFDPSHLEAFVMLRPTLLLIMLLPAIASAQTTIYQCQGNDGPVFSDRPCPGAKVLDLPPPNVIDTDAPSQAPDAPQATVPVPVYTAFSILQPDDRGTVHTNTGQFSVSLSLTPALQEGNSIAVSLDGTQLPTQRTSLQFDITPTEWEGAATDTTRHTLSATVIDGSGNVLISANPVQFYTHRATVRRESR
jgi:Domain of unknown function (DUF4124)